MYRTFRRVLLCYHDKVAQESIEDTQFDTFGRSFAGLGWIVACRGASQVVDRP